MSRAESAYAQFPYTPTKNQHLHTSAQSLHHHQYTQQQNQYATPQDSIIAPQTPSGTPNPQYTNTSIAPTLATQTRRYKTQQHTHTSIAPQTPPTPRQYPSTQHPSIAPPLNEHPPSPSQCLQTTNSLSSISSSIPTSLPTPPTVSAGLSSPNCPNSGTAAATSFDLQDIIAEFGSQPELLKLILTSKVEEDKRKAEEAKLRVRELDLRLFERDNNRRGKNTDHVDGSKNEDIHSNNDIDYENGNSIGSFSTSDGSLNYASYGTNLSSPVQSLSLNSPSSTHVSRPKPSRLNSISKDQNGQNTIESVEHGENNINGTPNKRKRKRREMLPVTMIVETKDRHNVDNFLWKNNGNTIQRKTGKKSVYFKCSNSNKGCQVNKTVTEKEGGWIVKYRGNHLEECGKIKRIVQS